MNHLAAALIRAGGGSMAASLLILPARARPPATKAAVAVEHFLTPRYAAVTTLPRWTPSPPHFPTCPSRIFSRGCAGSWPPTCRFMAADIMIYGVREEG